MIKRAWTALPLLLLMLTGCANKPAVEPIPRYPDMDAQQSLAVLRQRAEAVRTVSAQGLITLKRPDGESVRLDAALVMRPPDHLRLRAWKLGQAVFDLTWNPQGLWLLAPENSARRDQIRASGIGAAELARHWSLLSGQFFAQPQVRLELDQQRIIARGTASDSLAVICQIDRPTLTPRRYSLVDEQGAERFALQLDRYRQIGGISWPGRLTAISASGTIIVDLRDIELNGELPSAAFVPPRRAEKLP